MAPSAYAHCDSTLSLSGLHKHVKLRLFDTGTQAIPFMLYVVIVPYQYAAADTHLTSSDVRAYLQGAMM